jgi:hypothetical protein
MSNKKIEWEDVEKLGRNLEFQYRERFELTNKLVNPSRRDNGRS